MNKAKLLAPLLFTCVSHMALANSNQANADSDSCWSPPSSCMNVSATWSKHHESRVVVTYTNNCDHRVYLRKCNEKEDGSEDCGNGGLKAGRTTTWWTSDATGKYRWRMVGVLDERNDWTCARKIDDWLD